MAVALQVWVEKGKAPDALIATKYADADLHSIAFQRPLCVFPKVAQYRGGPRELAESFECVLPEGAR
jgi:feruloyl esterase